MKIMVKTALSLLVLAGSLALSAPRPAVALTCPAGSHLGHITLFYSDATYTTVICRTNDCNGGDYCNNPTPYYTETTVCCRP